jgi:glycosyltransferase involved in cell wall biosynthesis
VEQGASHKTPSFDASSALLRDASIASRARSARLMTSAFGRHGGIARAVRRVWRALPIGIPAKQRIRRFILDRLADAFHLLGRHHDVRFHPADRHTADHRPFAPCVTVVVPNYNHAPYLRQRLDSIYAQTYPNLRVILLDDCSTDDSRRILAEYAERYPQITKLDINERNSGGVFRQWRKAIASTDTDLIWIAESDDYCDPGFLSTLVPFFKDDAVKLAYAHSVFVTEDGAPSSFSFEDYVSELSLDRWRRSYVSAAHQEVSGYLGQKNTIPNVSSAVFRKFDLGRLLSETRWIDMRICGDWLFYLHALRGGKIAYSADVHNYYRFHSDNSSAKTYASETYYREHADVACEIARLYRVPPHTLDAHRHFVGRFFDQNAGSLKASGVEFSSLYSTDRIRAAGEARLPNVLVAAFAFASGGGEIFPIRLANALSERGHGVTFFDFRGEPTNPVVREMLKPEIPVVELTNRFLETEDIVNAFGIEVIHTHHASVDLFFGTKPKKPRSSAPHVITMHGMYDNMRPDLFDRTLREIYPGVATWVYISEKNLTPFREKGYLKDDRFIKIPNGMRTPDIRPVSRDALGIPAQAFVLCVASRAIPQKGWIESIQVTATARRLSKRDIHLLLLGDGPVYETLKHQALPPYVHLMGFVSQAVDYYAASDMGLLLTTFGGESFPLTVIECVMAGRPMVASDIGEIRDMLSDARGATAGYLVDIATNTIPIDSVAEEIAELVGNTERYSSMQATAGAIRVRFDMNRVVDQYGAVYRSAIAKRP